MNKFDFDVMRKVGVANAIVAPEAKIQLAEFDMDGTLCNTGNCCQSSRSRWTQRACRSGGIGRRAWFRSMYSQGCGGSSPFFGTNSIDNFSFLSVCTNVSQTGVPI